jgi:hypothetical protein
MMEYFSVVVCVVRLEKEHCGRVMMIEVNEKSEKRSVKKVLGPLSLQELPRWGGGAPHYDE